MAKGKTQENSKKASGQARKAESANKKKEQEAARAQAHEDAEWEDGAKGASKKEAEAAKKAEAARKRAERDALLKEEEAALPSKPLKSKQRGQEKVATRRTGKIDDFLETNRESDLNARDIDSALDALSITAGTDQKKVLDRHPERRFKAAIAAFEERRLPEIKKEHPGLRLNQYKELIKKEFDKSPENPFNQETVAYNAAQDEVEMKRKQLREETEKRLR